MVLGILSQDNHKTVLLFHPFPISCGPQGFMPKWHSYFLLYKENQEQTRLILCLYHVPAWSITFTSWKWSVNLSTIVCHPTLATQELCSFSSNWVNLFSFSGHIFTSLLNLSHYFILWIKLSHQKTLYWLIFMFFVCVSRAGWWSDLGP